MDSIDGMVYVVYKEANRYQSSLVIHSVTTERSSTDDIATKRSLERRSPFLSYNNTNNASFQPLPVRMYSYVYAIPKKVCMKRGYASRLPHPKNRFSRVQNSFPYVMLRNAGLLFCIRNKLNDEIWTVVSDRQTYCRLVRTINRSICDPSAFA